MGWLDIWKRIGGTFGSSPISISHTWVLGSGYSVEKQEEKDMATLKEACDSLLSNKDLQPSPDGSITHCNTAVQLVALAMGCSSFSKDMLANQMIDVMSDEENGWSMNTPEAAVLHASKGGLAVAAKKDTPHGHVAVVYPASMEMSGSWNRMVPVLLNIGKTVGVMRTSQAFPVAGGMPNFYLWENPNT